MSVKRRIAAALPTPLKKRILASRGIYGITKKAAIAQHHRLSQILHNRTEKHLILCGFPRSGTTMAYNMMRYSVEDTGVVTVPQELSALRSKNIYAENLITKRPLDAMDFEKIESEIGRFRDVRYVALIRDPRDSISSIHNSVPNQFFQDLETQMFLDESSAAMSFSNPGLKDIWAKIKSMKQSLEGRVMIVRYEDFVSDPETMKEKISLFSGFLFQKSFEDFHKANIPEKLRVQLNGVSKVRAKERPAWMEPERLKRVLQCYEAFPDLDDFCQELGYPSLQEMIDKYNPDMPQVNPVDPGTIFAFHTDDPVYTEEAQRFTSRLDQIGLPYDLKTISSHGDWVANCAKKASVLIDARDRIDGPLLYSDVDAYFHKNPWNYLGLYQGCDIAVYINKDGTLVSSSILVNDTPGARLILKLWKEEQEKTPTVWDQDVLRRVVLAEEAKPEDQQRFKIQRLPLSMCKIFDKELGYGKTPFIEQLQVSREGKWEEGSSAVVRRRARIKELFKK
jgi:hypothetical protein